MLTPEQQAAAEATLREWRREAPDQVPCHYCGTLVWLQHAEPVPDNPADPFDRYACSACGADGQGRKATRGRSARRGRARQVRARIVELARVYKEACAQHQNWYAELMGAEVLRSDVIRDHEQRTLDAMEQRRTALFCALEELEGLEEVGMLEDED